MKDVVVKKQFNFGKNLIQNKKKNKDKKSTEKL